MKIHETFKSNITYLLSKTVGELRGELTNILEKFELIPPHYGILIYLRENGPCVQQELATSLNIHKSSLGRLVDSLERMKLVTKKKAEDNKKEKWVNLTKSGTQISIEIEENITAMEKDFFKNLNLNERKTLRTLILKIHE